MANTTYVALLRGVNVGRAKRVAMAELRTLLAGLGYTEVRTLLNSGNAVFTAARGDTARLARDIEAALVQRFGFPVAVVVVTAAELAAIVAANPLLRIVTQPSRCLVGFTADRALLAQTRPLLQSLWVPEALAVGERAVYLWCPDGVIGSHLMQAFRRATGEAVTTRNWATVLKLAEAAGC